MEHPQHSMHMICSRVQPYVLLFVGRRVPHRQSEVSPSLREEWCRAMLILFKPWWKIDDLKDVGDIWEMAFDAVHLSENALHIMKNMDVESECEDARARLQTSSSAVEASGIPSGGGSLPMSDDEWESFATAVVNRESLQYDETSDLLDNAVATPNCLPSDRDVSDSLSTVYRASLLDGSTSVVGQAPELAGITDDLVGHIRLRDDKMKKELKVYRSKLQSIRKRKIRNQSEEIEGSDVLAQKRPQLLGDGPDVTMSVLSAGQSSHWNVANFRRQILVSIIENLVSDRTADRRWCFESCASMQLEKVRHSC
jgi:hypothetical protein